jgi:hypothetical protein
VSNSKPLNLSTFPPLLTAAASEPRRCGGGPRGVPPDWPARSRPDRLDLVRDAFALLLELDHGGRILHLAHGHMGREGLDLALQVLQPLLLALDLPGQAKTPELGEEVLGGGSELQEAFTLEVETTPLAGHGGQVLPTKPSADAAWPGSPWRHHGWRCASADRGVLPAGG